MRGSNIEGEKTKQDTTAALRRRHHGRLNIGRMEEIEKRWTVLEGSYNASMKDKEELELLQCVRHLVISACLGRNPSHISEDSKKVTRR